MTRTDITESLQTLETDFSHLDGISAADQVDELKVEKWKGIIRLVIVKAKAVAENENASDIEHQLLQLQLLLAQGLLDMLTESAEAKRTGRPS